MNIKKLYRLHKIINNMKVFKTNKGQFFLSILGISLLIFSHIYGCKTDEHGKIRKTSFSSTPFNEPQFTKEGELTFFSKNNNEIITIDIEIPDTPEEKRRGLMYRHVMADTEGMLFIHGMTKYRFFWMKNTYIPLDMIFVDKKMQIVKIEKNTTPLSEELISVPKETYYTIEVNAGFCDQHGIEIGDSIKALKIP
jgi:uncharacterized membrane protein (UPF0127 family)